MGGPSLKEDLWRQMNPSLDICHFRRRWLDDLTLLRSILLDFTFVVFLLSPEAGWANVSRKGDSCNLGPQINFLGFEIEWIRENLFVQVSSKYALY